MGSISFKGQLFLAFGAAAVLLAVVGVLSYRRIVQEEVDQNWVEHTHLVLEKLDSVLVDLIDQETGQRGYSLTRDRSFLEPYDQGRTRLQEDLAELRQVTSDNPKQQRALDLLKPLIRDRLALFQAQDTEDDSERSRAVAGKQLMDQIRSLLKGMKEEEQGLLARRLESATGASQRTKAVVATGAALALALLLVASFVVQSEIRKRTQTELELRLRNAQLDSAIKELEAFSYSVSHDLRAPLRGIDGFSQALLEDSAEKLDETEKSHLHRIRSGTQRMGVLIDDLLNLSRVARTEMHRERVDVTALARTIAAELRKTQPGRQAEFRIEDGLEAMGDPHLLRIVLENLLGNAWKFTSKRAPARIELGRTNFNGTRAYFVRDNGAGFDQAYVGKIFGAFQRLHGTKEFPGTGVGLATVQRIIHRHGGEIWAEGAVEKGASFYFTL